MMNRDGGGERKVQRGSSTPKTTADISQLIGPDARRAIDSRIFVVQERLLGGLENAEELLEFAPWLTRKKYADVVQERAECEGTCGFPVCSKKLAANTSIDLLMHERLGHVVHAMFCSEACKAKSEAFVTSIPNSHPYSREIALGYARSMTPLDPDVGLEEPASAAFSDANNEGSAAASSDEKIIPKRARLRTKSSSSSASEITPSFSAMKIQEGADKNSSDQALMNSSRRIPEDVPRRRAVPPKDPTIARGRQAVTTSGDRPLVSLEVKERQAEAVKMKIAPNTQFGADISFRIVPPDSEAEEPIETETNHASQAEFAEGRVDVDGDVDCATENRAHDAAIWREAFGSDVPDDFSMIDYSARAEQLLEGMRPFSYLATLLDEWSTLQQAGGYRRLAYGMDSSCVRPASQLCESEGERDDSSSAEKDRKVDVCLSRVLPDIIGALSDAGGALCDSVMGTTLDPVPELRSGAECCLRILAQSFILDDLLELSDAQWSILVLVLLTASLPLSVDTIEDEILLGSSAWQFTESLDFTREECRLLMQRIEPIREHMQRSFPE